MRVQLLSTRVQVVQAEAFNIAHQQGPVNLIAQRQHHPAGDLGEQLRVLVILLDSLVVARGQVRHITATVTGSSSVIMWSLSVYTSIAVPVA